MWKGDNPINRAWLHTWVRSRLQQPEYCPICNKGRAYDLANISPKYNPETYNRDLKNWYWCCRRCHMLSDGRMSNLEVGREKLRAKIQNSTARFVA